MNGYVKLDHDNKLRLRQNLRQGDKFYMYHKALLYDLIVGLVPQTRDNRTRMFRILSAVPTTVSCQSENIHSWVCRHSCSFGRVNRSIQIGADAAHSVFLDWFSPWDHRFDHLWHFITTTDPFVSPSETIPQYCVNQQVLHRDANNMNCSYGASQVVRLAHWRWRWHSTSNVGRSESWEKQ